MVRCSDFDFMFLGHLVAVSVEVGGSLCGARSGLSSAELHFPLARLSGRRQTVLIQCLTSQTSADASEDRSLALPTVFHILCVVPCLLGSHRGANRGPPLSASVFHFLRVTMWVKISTHFRTDSSWFLAVIISIGVTLLL